MTSVIESHTLEQYLAEVQRFRILSNNNPQAKEELLSFIGDRVKAEEESSENTLFFKGEHAFYREEYETALVKYMKARSVPKFEFFCFRATAFVSFHRGDFEKSMSFIQKALDFEPQDYSCLILEKEIYIRNGQNDKAAALQEKIEQIESLAHTVETPTPEEPNIKEEIINEFAKEEMEPVEIKQESEAFTTKTTNQFVATKLGVDLETEKALEDCLNEYQVLQTKYVQDYLEEANRKKRTKDHVLYTISGWKENDGQSTATEKLLEEHSRKNTGGYFVRWNGKGVVINPGPDFLENFHNNGLHINDIDFVIVTRDELSAHKDVKRIYDLNYKLNKVSPELHVIHYYIDHKGFQDLSSLLNPNFKQERNTVHCLELFLDSPDVEKEELSEGITLNYFSTSSRGGFATDGEFKGDQQGAQPHSLGIRLDLRKYEAGEYSIEPVRLGYVSGAAWSPLIAHHFGRIDLLITGFGTTNPNDYGKLNYNEKSLGYFGTYSLLEEVKPKLLLCTEFDGRKGDIRLEVVKKLRKEFANLHPSSDFSPQVLPADNGLLVNLNLGLVECSVSRTYIEPKNVVVVKSAETFGKIVYLSGGCIL